MSDPVAGALAGIRVIDFGQYIAGPLVAQLLADHGADVIRVDPPDGPRWRADANAILQRGKRSIMLDLKQSDDRSTAQCLVGTADIVVENFRPGVMDGLGLGANAMLDANPALIYCSIPGFAADDPRAGLRAGEGIVGSAAGLYGPRDLDGDGEPVYNTLPLASCFGALIAANSIMAALIARQRGTAGQRIEVSLFDACFELTRYYADRAPGAPYPRIRLGSTHAMALTQHYACRDGRFVHLSWLEGGRQLEAFARLLGVTETWARDDLLDFARVRRDRAYSDRLRHVLEDVFRTRTAAEWMALANPDADLAECLSSQEWLAPHPQAHATRAVISLEDPELGPMRQAGHAVSMSRTPPVARGARHALDADRAAILAELESELSPRGGDSDSAPLGDAENTGAAPQTALQGIRALDLTQILAGPTACRILAEYGAEVVQIVNPHARAGHDFHLSVNGGKRSILLDLKQPAAMDVFWSLVDRSAIVSTNFSPDVAERLGVAEAQVRARRPDVIYSRISAYGLDGPLRDFRGHEQVGQAISGMQVRWGSDAPTPLMQPHPVNDFGTGHLAALGMLVALFHRLRTGQGQLVGASLAQTATLLQTPFMVTYPGRASDEPGGQRCKGLSAFERLVRTNDGWLFVAADSREAIEGLDFSTEPAEWWVQRLRTRGIASHVLKTPEQAMDDAWARAHGVSRDVDFPEAGRGRIVGPAPRLSATPMRATPPPPPPGWHARAVLDELGLVDRLPRLVAGGAVVLVEPLAVAPAGAD